MVLRVFQWGLPLAGRRVAWGPIGLMPYWVAVLSATRSDTPCALVRALTPTPVRVPQPVPDAAHANQCLPLDMRVLDRSWIGMKLRSLLSYAEPLDTQRRLRVLHPRAGTSAVVANVSYS